MWRGSRRLLAVLALVSLTALSARAADLGTMKIGALKFGTVNWELDVIKAHGLDAKEGFTLEIVPFGANDAADVALMGGAVNAVVEDWLFVSRPRSDGVPLTFIPYSSNVGAVMVRPDSPAMALTDLVGKKLGVAGGPLDKNWLLIQGMAKRDFGLDLAPEPLPAAPGASARCRPAPSAFNWPPSQLKFVMVRFAPRISALVMLKLLKLNAIII